MDSKNRIAIIMSRLKPEGKMSHMRSPDKMMSEDFSQEVDSDSDVELETYAEDMISAVKNHDVAGVVEAFKCMFEAMSHHEETESSPEAMSEGD